MIGPGIIIPIVAVTILVPTAIIFFKRYLRRMTADVDVAPPSGARLTAEALHRLPAPPWRVVHEVPRDLLGEVDHVLIGPPGIFAITTSLAVMPEPLHDPPSAEVVARGAIARGELDDVLRRCAMESSQHVAVHWGRADDAEPVVVEVAPGSIAVSGHRIDEWFESLAADGLSPSRVDLAWQTVAMGIGRPDPL